MSTGHALLSPSGADRWMLCPGSVAMTADLPDTSNIYGDEGTAAHFLASEALTACSTAHAFTGEDIVVEDTGARFLSPNGAYVTGSRSFTIDDDMARHVQKYIDLVLDLAGEGELHVEQRLPIGHITGEEDAHGTSDAVVIRDNELIVVDLKYGMGNRVDADNNRQLMLYALGALEEFGMVYDIQQVRLVISQPRLDHVSEWLVALPALLEFAGDAMGAAKAATLAHKFAGNWRGNTDAAYLVPGEAQCKWCKAKATCPALASFVQAATGCDFDDLCASNPEQFNAPETVGKSLRAVSLIEDWCKAVRAKGEALLFEHNNSAEIIAALGWKLVQGKKGNRAWRNAEEAEELLKKMRVQHDKMYDYKLISPTTAEKLAKSDVIGPRQWPKVEAMITQSPGKPSVAPESDKRPALEIAPTADAFDDVSANELV